MSASESKQPFRELLNYNMKPSLKNVTQVKRRGNPTECATVRNKNAKITF